MKNIYEVASISLCSPHSTDSYLCYNDPEFKYTHRSTQSATVPALVPDAYRALFKERPQQDITVGDGLGEPFSVAQLELLGDGTPMNPGKIKEYEAEYDNLRTGAALDKNDYITCSTPFYDFYNRNFAYYRDNPAYPMNRYQPNYYYIQMIKMADYINKTHRDSVTIEKTLAELGQLFVSVATPQHIAAELYRLKFCLNYLLTPAELADIDNFIKIIRTEAVNSTDFIYQYKAAVEPLYSKYIKNKDYAREMIRPVVDELNRNSLTLPESLPLLIVKLIQYNSNFVQIHSYAFTAAVGRHIINKSDLYQLNDIMSIIVTAANQRTHFRQFGTLAPKAPADFETLFKQYSHVINFITPPPEKPVIRAQILELMDHINEHARANEMLDIFGYQYACIDIVDTLEAIRRTLEDHSSDDFMVKLHTLDYIVYLYSANLDVHKVALKRAVDYEVATRAAHPLLKRYHYPDVINQKNALNKYIKMYIGEIKNAFGSFRTKGRVQDLLNRLQQASNGETDTVLQNTIMVSSPTGTGKTLQYMNFIGSLSKGTQHSVRPHTIVFTSTSALVKQIYKFFCMSLKDKITCVTESKAANQAYLNITTSGLYNSMAEESKNAWDSTVQQSIDLPINDLSPYQYHVANGHKYCFYVPQPGYNPLLRDIYNHRLNGEFGGIIIAPLHLYELLFIAGVVDDLNTFQTVVFDEVDVFYNLKSIPEFHRFFYQHPSIYRCYNIVFCSATIKSKFIREYDSYLSQGSDTLFYKQLTGVRGLQDSQTASNYQFFLYTDNMPAKTSTSSAITSHIYLNYNEYLQISQNGTQLTRPYYVFAYQGQPSNLDRLLRTNKGALVSNYPLYAFYTKDVIKMPYKYLKPINEFVPLINVYNYYVDPTEPNAGFIPVGDGIQDYTLNVEDFVAYAFQSLYDVVLLETCKPPYDMAFFSFNGTDYVYNPAPIVPIPGRVHTNDIDALIQAAPVDKKLGEGIRLSYSLFLYVINNRAHQELRNEVIKYVNMDAYIPVADKPEYNMLPVFNIQNYLLPDMNYDVVNPDTPFYLELCEQIKKAGALADDINMTRLMGDADLYNGGRGLDIEGLTHVYILIPMFLNLKDIGITYNSIKYAVGRVGRAGRVGHSHIVKYMYRECTNAADFTAFVYDLANKGGVYADIASEYQALTFDIYTKNEALINSIIDKVKKDFRY